MAVYFKYLSNHNQILILKVISEKPESFIWSSLTLQLYYVLFPDSSNAVICCGFLDNDQNSSWVLVHSFKLLRNGDILEIAQRDLKGLLPELQRNPNLLQGSHV